MSKHSSEKEKGENLFFKQIPRSRFTFISQAYEWCLACQHFQKVSKSGPWGYSGFQVTGIIEGFFGSKIFYSRTLLGRKIIFGKYFLGLSRDFWDYSEQSVKGSLPHSSLNEVQPKLSAEIRHGIFWG